MPKQVLPGPEDLQRISRELLERGFFWVQGLSRFRFMTKDQRALPPRPREGREIGFAYQKDNLAVVVWTSQLASTHIGRTGDSGWVVIEQDGQAVYFERFHRTAHFVEHILRAAKIARVRVRCHPICPVCKGRMAIVKGRGLGSRYWKCASCRTRESWDSQKFLQVLPPEEKKFLFQKRKVRRRRYRQAHKEGMPIRQAMLTRRKWEKIQLPVSGF